MLRVRYNLHCRSLFYISNDARTFRRTNRTLLWCVKKHTHLVLHGMKRKVTKMLLLAHVDTFSLKFRLFLFFSKSPCNNGNNNKQPFIGFVCVCVWQRFFFAGKSIIISALLWKFRCYSSDWTGKKHDGSNGSWKRWIDQFWLIHIAYVFTSCKRKFLFFSIRVNDSIKLSTQAI